MAARKRSEVMASAQQTPTTSAEERTIPLPLPPTPPPARLAMEADLSAMCIRLKQKGFKVGVTQIAGWDPQDRHIVAMWLENLIDECPAIVATYPLVEAEAPLDLAGHAKRIEAKPLALVKSVAVKEREPDVPEAYEGLESVTVCVGEDSYSPVQYNNFRVGGFTATANVRPGETHIDAGRRALVALRALYAEEFPIKRDTFIANLRGIKAKMGGA